MSVRIAAVFLLLICVANAETNKTWKSYSVYLNQGLEGKTLIDPRENSPALVFGYCQEGVCTFFRERETVDRAPHLRSCRINFDKGEVIELYPFGSDKIVFMYEIEENNKRFGILHFSNCHWYLAHISDNAKMMYARVIATDDNQFEITVNNYGKGMMCRRKECKMTFNKEGYEWKRLYEWLEEDNYRSVAFSNERGYIVVDGNIVTRSVVVYTVDDRGKTHHLMNYTSHLIPPVSTTHKLVTTCGTMETHLKCVQFNANGDAKFETALMYKNVKQAKLHNLPNGGFVLLTSKCSKTIGECAEPISHFVATKVDATGKIEGRFKVTDFSHDLSFQLNRVYFFLNDNAKELCFSSVYKRHLRNEDEQIVEIFCRNNNFSL